MDPFSEERDAIPPARPNSLVHPSIDEPAPFANSFLPEAVLAPMPGDDLSALLPHHEPITRGLDSSLLIHNPPIHAEPLPLGGALGGLGNGGLSSFSGLEQQLPLIGGSSSHLGTEMPPSSLLGAGGLSEGLHMQPQPMLTSTLPSSSMLGAGGLGDGLHREAVTLCSELDGPLHPSGPHLHLREPAVIAPIAGNVLTSDMPGVPPPPPLSSAAIPQYTGTLQTADFNQAIHPTTFSSTAAAAPGFANTGHASTFSEEPKHESFIDKIKEKKHIHDQEKAVKDQRREIEKVKEEELKDAGFNKDVAHALAQQQPPLQGPIITNAMPGVPNPPPVTSSAPPPVVEHKKHRSLKEILKGVKKEDKENATANAHY